MHDEADPIAAADTATLLMRGVAFRYASTGFGLEVDRFRLGPGESVFLRGPSGSGKTTFLSLATGLLLANRGAVEIDGRTMPRSAARRDALRADRIGVIHQQFNLLPYLDTETNVLLPVAFGRDASAGPDEARRMLGALGVPENLFGAPAGTLSVGQQQRVAIARALLGRPALVVADEPTSALDTDARDVFLALLFDAVREAGSALLMVSHDPAMAGRFDRALDLREIANVTTAKAA